MHFQLHIKIHDLWFLFISNFSMEKRIRSHKRTAPGTHLVQFRANTEGIKSFMPNDLSSFEYTLACSFCGKVINDVKINSEQTTTEGSEKKVNYSISCPDCKKEFTFTYIKDYTTNVYNDYSIWNNLFLVDCTGCRIDIIQCNAWKIVSQGDESYEWDGKDNFFDYDAKLEKPIGISDVDFNVVTLIE